MHLINGSTIDSTFQRNAVLIPRLMKEHESAATIIELLYIRILTRKPTPIELQAMLDLSPDSPDERARQKFFSSVAWALVNSNEFLFNH